MLQPPRLRCVLVVAGGASRRVGAAGVVIGRQRDCDIVTPDPAASRRHALVRLTSTAAELVPLGRGTLGLGGRVVRAPCALAHGDVIELPGLAITVELATAAPDPDAASFVLESDAGTFGVAHTPFAIGGCDEDDLIIRGWPTRALLLHVAQDELYLEAVVGNARLGDTIITPGALENVAVGDAIRYRDRDFRVARCERATTTAVTSGDAPVAAAIEILPSGGRIVFTLADGDRAVYLADRRFDLLVALLRPPPGYAPGESIPDEVVAPIVWPRKTDVSRNVINTLISRCRRDLVEAGLAGPRLLERAPGGGATRFVLAPRAEISVVS